MKTLTKEFKCVEGPKDSLHILTTDVSDFISFIVDSPDPECNVIEIKKKNIPELIEFLQKAMRT